MKIKLKESQLINLIKEVINEQQPFPIQNKEPMRIDQVDSGIKKNLDRFNALTTNFGYILFFIFPYYRPEADDTLMNRIVAYATGGYQSKKGKVKLGAFGHGGCIIVSNDGNAKLYEFAPYKKKEIGNVEMRDLGNIAKFKNNNLLNPEIIAQVAKSKTQHDGPRETMLVALHLLKDTQKANSFAQSVGQHEYSAADFNESGKSYNCVTFALQVGLAGGADVKRSYVTPLPLELFYNNFKDNAIKIFKV